MVFRAMSGLCALIGVVSPCVTQADTVARAERAVAAFQGWVADNGTSGALVLVRHGDVVAEVGFGRAVDAPMELASVSKTITGICASELVSRGVMSWSDTAATRLGEDLDITLAQLVTHQGGLKDDSTQTAMPEWLDASGTHKSSAVLDLIVARGGASKVAAEYWYNNENFALVGLMIEQASARKYGDICFEVAIAPAGVQAQASPRSGSFQPWGGWQMSPADLAQWHAHWFAANSDLVNNPKGLPYATIEKGLYYGAGTTFRTLTPGNTFWHFGSLCFPGRMNAGSYAATLFKEWTIVAAWDACLDWSDMLAVDQRVIGALFADP